MAHPPLSPSLLAGFTPAPSLVGSETAARILQESEHFGALHADGSNPQQTALLNTAVLAYMYADGLPKQATDEQEDQLDRRIAGLHTETRWNLQAHFQNTGDGSNNGPITEAQANEKLGAILAAAQQAKEDARPLTEALPGIFKTLGITLHEGAMDEAEQLLAKEAEARDAMIAIAQGKGKDNDETKQRAGTQTGKSVGSLEKERVEEAVAGIDTIINAAVANGHPKPTANDIAFMKAVWRYETGAARDMTDNEYLIAGGITGALEFAGATLRTGQAAIGDMYTAYQEAGGEWSREQFTKTLKTKANAVWGELKETVGTEGTARFKSAYYATSRRVFQEVSENVALAISHHDAHLMRGADRIPQEILQAMYEENPDAYFELTGSRDAPTKDTSVLYADMTAKISPNGRMYANILTLTNGGKGPQVPIAKELINQTPTALLRDEGITPNLQALASINESAQTPIAGGKTVERTDLSQPLPATIRGEITFKRGS